jgi:predicted dehydrogenase
MSKVRAVLIGTGGWGRAHVQAIRQCRDLELVGVGGHQDRERLQAMCAECGGVPGDLDLARLLRDTRPEVVDVCCNPHFRLEGVQLAVAAGARLVNLEKPMALTPGEAYAIEALCRKTGTLLTVNHQKKFLPAWAKVRRLIDAGTFGQVRFLRATCQGNLLEQGTHVVDMLLFFHGGRPLEWVMGQVGDLEGLDKTQAAAPDAAMAAMAFSDGVRVLFECGNVGRVLPGETNKWHQFAIEVYGDAGHACVTLNRTLSVTTYADGRTVTEPSSWDRDYLNAIALHFDAVAAYVRNPAAGHISDLDRSLASFNAVMAIYASACRGGRVSLPCRFEDSLIGELNALRQR